MRYQNVTLMTSTISPQGKSTAEVQRSCDCSIILLLVVYKQTFVKKKKKKKTFTCINNEI